MIPRASENEPVERLRVDELDARLGELRAHEERQQAGDREEGERRDQVLDADHLVVGVDPEVVLPGVGAVAGVVLRPRRADPRSSRTSSRRLRARPGSRSATKIVQKLISSRQVPDGVGVQRRPRMRQTSAVTSPNAERRHPQRAQPAGAREAPEATRRRSRRRRGARRADRARDVDGHRALFRRDLTEVVDERRRAARRRAVAEVSGMTPGW